MIRSIPKPGEPVVDSRGLITRPWRDYLAGHFGADVVESLQFQLDRLTDRVDGLAGSDIPAGARVAGQMSVTSYGVIQDGLVTLSLVNDTETPGEAQYYGTDDDGELGYHDLARTTDDLPEGEENLYYTDDRADARISAARSDPDGVASLSGGRLPPDQAPVLPVSLRNEDYTLTAVDAVVSSEDGEDYVWTIPAFADVPFLSGWRVLLIHDGAAGTKTVAPDSGVTLMDGTASGDVVLQAGECAELIYLGYDRWRVV